MAPTHRDVQYGKNLDVSVHDDYLSVAGDASGQCRSG
jgi:hypothetical protein